MGAFEPSSLPRISIVTPSFNQARYLGRTIDSVLSQDYPNLEYLVIDGGSTDGSVDILRKCDKRVSWISEPDRGQSDAINKGLRRSTGEILAYLNSDDLLLPGCLHRIGRFFAEHSEVEWLTGYCTIIGPNGEPARSAIERYKNFLVNHYSLNLLLIINFISQMSTFWRRSAMERIGEFSTEHHLVMDYDFWLRLASHSAPAILPETLSAFRVHRDAKGSQRFVRQFQESFRVARPYLTNPFLRTVSWLHNYAVIAIYSIGARVPGLRPEP